MLRYFLCILFLLPLAAQAQTPHPRPITGATSVPQAIVMPADKSATHSSWSFLSLGATHADAFEREHPTYDGRGVIIMIFDTGVDPGVPGLGMTSDGRHKVIEVRDYSGTGDVLYAEAERSGDVVKVAGAAVLHGLNSLKSKAYDGKYYYGALPEKRFQNGLADLNFNSSDTDTFGVLVYQDAPNHYVGYVDSDGDHDLANEHELTNYHERYDTFVFHSIDTTESSGKRLTGAINIYPECNLASIYFDDGSHGTHVAGIAAGHDIDNQKGFNGVAPGAEIIAIKFADNSAGGVTVTGSMQRAFQYAAEMANSQPKPVVVNMSFGIGNELEGKSAMDKWLDSLLAATPNLTVCVSAGNEGPGLSSIGLPGSADRVISSGAALPDDAARDLYKTYINHPVLFDFSSRGGELAKPDLVSPGTAVSTVPDFVGSDRYNGTSMSSPYTAGCAAVLLSAMTQAFPDWTPNAFAVKRAMMLSATHIESATPLDEGFGMINIAAAFDLLSRWQRNHYTPIPVHVHASVPSAVKNGSAAYFRAGNFPIEGEREMFTIVPEEPAGTSEHLKAVGMEAFDLVSDEPWMSPVESSVYHRGEGAITVDVRYNAKLLQKPGIYIGRIWGYDKLGVRGPGTGVRGDSRFELLNTIIIPHSFSDVNNYRVTLSNIKLTAASGVQREFFAIPPGAKSVKMILSAHEGKSGCSVSLFDNDGKEFSGFGIRRGSSQHTTTANYTGTEFTPGVWEADLSRTLASEDELDLTVDLTVEVQPLDVRDLTAAFDDEGRPHIRLTASNPSQRTFAAQPQAAISGYERTIDTLITMGDVFTLPFSQRPGERAAIFDVSLPPEDYNLFTDITCMVLRSDSSAVLNSAFDYRKKMVPVHFSESARDDSSADVKSDGHYLLYIRGGLALPDHPHAWHIRVRESRYLQHDRSLTATPVQLNLQPFQSQEIEFKSETATTAAPAGYRTFGEVELRKSELDDVRMRVSF